MTQAMTRNELRAAIFAAENKKPKSKEITLFGQKVDIRQPTVGEVTAMVDKAGKPNVSAIVTILITYCYVPGTDEKVFEEADREGLLSMPTGQWLTDLNNTIEELTGVNVKEQEKNSDAAPSDSPL